MTQLFSKNRKLSLLLISSCVIFYGFNSIFNLKKTDPFLEYCKNSDAYFLFSNTNVTYSQRWSNSVKAYVSVNNKIVVNTAKGVEDYAFLNLSEKQTNQITNIKIRTLKADGSIVELDSSLVFKKKANSFQFEAISYPIPAVEPGDTIETSYEYSEYLKKSELMSYVDLNTKLPSLRSQYSVITGAGILIRYKPYNDFPEPKILSNDTLVNLQFSMDKIKGVTDNEYSCLPCDLPYLYYSLEKRDSKPRSWLDVYNEEFNFLTQPLALDYDRSSYYKRWKRRTLGKAKDSSKYYQFKLLFNEVVKNFNVEKVQTKELIKSSGYFLKKKRFDLLSIRRFYRQLLEDLEIDYWAVFARSKRLGEIDTHYIRLGEFDHVFFAYENENGGVNFLYPHVETYKYQIDELPTSLYNTDAVLVKPLLKEKRKKRDKFISRSFKFAEVDSISTAKVKLPGMSANLNYLNQVIYGDVNIKDKATKFKYRFKASGGLSTEIRSFIEMVNSSEEVSKFYETLFKVEGNDNTVQLDTILNRRVIEKKPFTYILNAEGTLNNVVTYMNDSLVSISIDKLLQHSQINSDTNSEKLNYYLDYSFSDQILMYLNFPSEIEILGADGNNLSYKNDYGEYYFELRKSKKNQLKLHSSYKIIKNYIPKEKLDNIKLLNEQFKNIRNKRLIIKLKK
jgi:hypothetical protein